LLTNNQYLTEFSPSAGCRREFTGVQKASNEMKMPPQRGDCDWSPVAFHNFQPIMRNCQSLWG